MSVFDRGKFRGAILGVVLAVCAVAPVHAAESPLYESDPTLSLLGNCETIAGIDPIPDPSCPYSAPPVGPAGRFEQPRPIAVDPYGNEYVISFAGGNDAKGRVDVFDDEGKFITEANVPDAVTAAVDSKGNLYVFRNNGEVVRYSPSEYQPEEGKIKYEKASALVASGAFNGAVAVDTDPAHLDQVLISRPTTIARYKSAADAEPNGLIETYEPSGLGFWPEAMAIDSQRRRIYVSFCKNANEECGVKVLDADDPEVELEEIDGSTVPNGKFAAFSGLLPVAVDEGTGDFFIADPTPKKIYRFSEGYEFLSQLEFKELQTGSMIAVSNGKRSVPKACKYPTNPVPPAGDACNRHYLFVPVFQSTGRVAAFRPPGQTSPVIESVSVTGIGETEAELEATIFPGGLPTEYSFQITTQAAWEAETEKFKEATTIPGGTIGAESLAAEVSAFATGLTPGETYRFRAVAENELGSAEEEGQNEAVFSTYDDATTTTGPCPNEPFRIGLSAQLPDCRAYELVTPADTNGRPPKGTGELGSLFSTLQASPTGNAVSFTIEGGSIPGSSGVASFFGDPYVSKRGSAGWGTDLAGPTGAEATQSAPASVSPDQGYAFWRAGGEGPLVIEPLVTEYLHYPDGHSELVGRGSEGTEPRATGKLITEDATHVVFQSFNLGFNKAVKLEPNAPPEGTEAIYDRTIDPVTGSEETHVVSLLPGDVTPALGKDADYQGASNDGEGIAFSIGGKLYLRVNNATTYEIGENVEFAGISEGAERVFYLQGGDLKALDTTATPEVINFSNTGNAVPLNVSTDGIRAYFVSTSALGGANPAGEVAQAGEQNLYLSEEGAVTFVATVTERDVEGEPPAGVEDGLGLWTEVAATQPAKDPSRLNPDGSVLLFQSRAEITGYPESEFPQIYRFDAKAEELACISCIPTGTPASGGASLESYSADSFSGLPFSAYGFVPNLNPQGTRVIFESTEALVSDDTDEVNDVYEWEADGEGSCEQPQGCVYLISSGVSESANYLYGHSASGSDVFFTTADRLTGWDSAGGALSIYDARVNGGFPEPTGGDICVGDGCRPDVTPAPSLPTTQSSGQGRSGNIEKPKTCPKGKRKVKQNGKVRCVKKKQGKKGKGGKAKSRAGANRRAGR